MNGPGSWRLGATGGGGHWRWRGPARNTRAVQTGAFNAFGSGAGSPKQLFHPDARSQLLFLSAGILGAVGLMKLASTSYLKRNKPYQFSLTFEDAPGLYKGTPLLMKGVVVGTVADIVPKLDSVDVTIEVHEFCTAIPKGSRFELSAGGMLSPAPRIDIRTPPAPPADALERLQQVRGQQQQQQQQQQAAVGAASSSSSRGGEGGGDSSEPSTSGRGGGLTWGQVARTCSLPVNVDACDREGLMICAGSSQKGEFGASMDDMTQRFVWAQRGGRPGFPTRAFPTVRMGSISSSEEHVGSDARSKPAGH